MSCRVGFIGSGNMAKAMIGGLITSKLVSAEKIIASAKSTSTIKNIHDEYKIEVTLDNKRVVKDSDVIIIAVKPNVYSEVLSEIKDEINEEKIVVTIAAGITLKDVENIIGDNKKIVRTMPNTPALVNEAMCALCPNDNIKEEDLSLIQTIFNSFGRSEVVKEELIDAVIGVSGSSPAYVYMFIEAMADCAVSYGMPRKQAYEFAAQAVLGSAKMVLETGIHPGELKDNVCSPGGTTIEGVKTLEAEGFRKAVIKGMEAVIEKSKEMSLK